MARNMGPRYMGYRLRLMLETRLGVLERRFPVDLPEKRFISKDEWLGLDRFVFSSRSEIRLQAVPNPELARRAERIKQGVIPFFSAIEFDLGSQFDWVTHPQTGKKYDVSKHWSRIPDLDPEMGDIKFVWEKSRFSYVHTVLRSDFHNGSDSSEWFFNELDSWIEANPIHRGPNWRCSQEISLRCFNWLFGLRFYAHSQALSPERWARYQNVFYWSLKRVYDHIDFSRIAVRNNHAITETAFLALSEMLFPFIPETKKWARKGRIWLEEEVAYQIYPDGTHLQFSTNYQRVVVQLLSLCLAVAKKNHSGFSEVFRSRAAAAHRFLDSALEASSGRLPNYGANDGALFFQFSDCDFSDFRPQLECLAAALGLPSRYKRGAWSEEAAWFGLNEANRTEPEISLDVVDAFASGGFYGLRQQQTYTFLRCGKHKDRPSQADNLHLDLWHQGENWLRDAGSYKYNTDEATLRYFAGTESHNALMVDGADQMLKGPRFVWFYWSQAESKGWQRTEEGYRIEMSMRAFAQLEPGLIHTRSIFKSAQSAVWEVEDRISSKVDRSMVQRWHPHPDRLKRIKIEAFDSEARPLERVEEQAWYSRLYGIKESAPQWAFSCKGRLIRTRIEFLNEPQ